MLNAEPSDFDRAIADAHRRQSGCGASVNPACRPVLLEHGRRTSVAVAWLHGYTNCPKQFEALGHECFKRGWNVWIPLAPRHGLADRMTEATSKLTAGELMDWGEQATDVARGLGERVVVGGLSMGGAVAAWLGQRRSDIAVALPIAPLVSPLPVPPFANRLAAVLAAILPNHMVWWDPKARESLAGPRQAYYRYATHGMAQGLRMGFAFADAARRALPAAGAFRFVLNDNDEALSNAAADAILARWKRNPAANVDVVRLGVELGLKHDCIDPAQPYQRVAVSYPIIVGAIEDALATLP